MNQTRRQPRCSVVIRSFNEEAHIGRLLSGLLKQTIREVEILLVDSGSTDATLAIASRFPVRILRVDPSEFTFGRSLNLGCGAATSEIVVIASAHIYPVYPDWLETLLEAFSDPGVALVYGKQRGAETTRYGEHQIFHKWYPDESVRGQGHPFCNNANAAIRRGLWKAHPYDETLSGLEDIEWASWAIGEGWTIAYEARAEVIHVHQESPRDVYNRYRREAMALRRIRPQERLGLLDACRLFVSNAATDLWHAAHDGVLLKEAGGILWFRLMQFWGSYRGSRLTGALTSQLKQTFYYPRALGRSQSDPRRPIAPISYEKSDVVPAVPRADPPSPAENEG